MVKAIGSTVGSCRPPKDAFRSRFTAVDTLRDADAVIGVAGEGKVGVGDSASFNSFDALKVANFVLRHRRGPAGDIGPQECAGDVHQRSEFFVGNALEFVRRRRTK